jgi:hypothetical protein
MAANVTSALGHKPTYAVQKGPRKRTCAVQLSISALGQKRTPSCQAS